MKAAAIRKQGDYMDVKVWYESRTLWVNLISIGAMILQSKLGWVIDAENQILILGIVNIILRAVTKKPVVLA